MFSVLLKSAHLAPNRNFMKILNYFIALTKGKTIATIKRHSIIGFLLTFQLKIHIQTFGWIHIYKPSVENICRNTTLKVNQRHRASFTNSKKCKRSINKYINKYIYIITCLKHTGITQISLLISLYYPKDISRIPQNKPISLLNTKP